MSRHRDQRPDPATYRPSAGLTLADRTAEQDRAAGGRAIRLVTRDDGTVVLASVALRSYPKSRRIYAYLRWSASSHGTAERYIGDVSACPDRAAALRIAWQHVHPSDQADVPLARIAAHT
jgi:DNA mismatch endonuclease, patch repair protein